MVSKVFLSLYFALFLKLDVSSIMVHDLSSTTVKCCIFNSFQSTMYECEDDCVLEITLIIKIKALGTRPHL